MTHGDTKTRPGFRCRCNVVLNGVFVANWWTAHLFASKLLSRTVPATGCPVAASVAMMVSASGTSGRSGAGVASRLSVDWTTGGQEIGWSAKPGAHAVPCGGVVVMGPRSNGAPDILAPTPSIFSVASTTAPPPASTAVTTTP